MFHYLRLNSSREKGLAYGNAGRQVRRVKADPLLGSTPFRLISSCIRRPAANQLVSASSRSARFTESACNELDIIAFG